jgi:hypothetical protein
VTYKRDTSLVLIPDEGDQLTAAMVGIGMQFSHDRTYEANIEDTIVSASVPGVIGTNFRVLGVLVVWLGVHYPWINVDRLTRIVEQLDNKRLVAFWSAVGQWLKSDNRFGRLAKLYKGERVVLGISGPGSYPYQKYGEDPRFAGTCIATHAALLRDRPQDALPPHWLAKIHRVYRYRVKMGATYKTDLWAEIEANPGLSVAELARKARSSYATAWQVRKDWKIINFKDKKTA